MKKMMSFCMLLLITLSAYAETCPPTPAGYLFRVAAWGDHTKKSDKVRCYYYYSRDQTQSTVFTTREMQESSFTSHPEWSDGGLYRLCVSRTNNVNDCPFN